MVSLTRLPIVPLVTDKEVRDLSISIAEAKAQLEAADAIKRAKCDAFWRSVGLVEDQPDYGEPVNFDDLPC